MQCIPCLTVFDSNPHILQANHKHNIFPDFCRHLYENYPESEYQRRNQEKKTVLHRGQLKLLLSEIEFLTEYSKKNDILVYVGAAPGRHIDYLTKLFPDLAFHLYDPAPFHHTLYKNKQCILYACCFEDQHCYQYIKQSSNVLLISDLRTGDFLEDDHATVEKHICDNMTSQRRWYDTIQPREAMLKFRLPWDSTESEYLNGTLHFQCFAGATSTETRLIVKAGTKIYDHKKYQDQMFYFNTVSRVGRYAHVLNFDFAQFGLDYCYDCSSFVNIVYNYVKLFYEKLTDLEQKNMTQNVVEQCIQACYDDKQTLFKTNFDPAQRFRSIRKRQWIDGKPAYEADVKKYKD